MMNKNELIFFCPGDICTVRHNIENRPRMWVTDKITRSIMNKEGEKESIFIGIRCKWFAADGTLQEAVFSTKDLMKIE